MPKKEYPGKGEGDTPVAALHAALNDAWEKAKGDRAHGKKLKVEQWYVKGDNPLNWSSIVLIDENPGGSG